MFNKKPVVKTVAGILQTMTEDLNEIQEAEYIKIQKAEAEIEKQQELKGAAEEERSAATNAIKNITNLFK